MNAPLQTQAKGHAKPSFTLTRSVLFQRKCACGTHTMAGGECAECGKKKRLGLQTKLKVNEPGDIYEQEADRIADQVMATPVHHAVSGSPPRIQRFSGQPTGQVGVAPASVDQALASPGRPLEPRLRQDMERHFGHDFSMVRVHSGAAAWQSARDVNAHAYTVGQDIVFGPGQFAPGTHEGRRLLAHELTHVVQQSDADGIHADQRNENRDLSAIPSQPRLQRRPPPGCDICLLGPSDELKPPAWFKCVRKGCFPAEDADPLRFAKDGVVATPAELDAWMRREGITIEKAITLVTHSHEFAGTLKAREEAKAAWIKARKEAEVALINTFPMEKLSVCIRAVQIADDDGKKPTVLPSFDAAKAIWGKCCVVLSVKAAKTVSKTAFKTLDDEPSKAPMPTAEEAGLFAAAGGTGGCISVFVAETFQQGGRTSKDISGGAATRYAGGDEFAVVAVEGVDPTIVAHELGHATGYRSHKPAGTVMEVTASRHDQKESDKVAKVICDKVRTFTSAKASGKEDCYSDVSQ